VKVNEIILGIDPGTNIMGYAVIEIIAGKPVVLSMDVLKLAGEKDI